MHRAEFFETPYRRLVTIAPRDTALALPDEIEGVVIRLQVPAALAEHAREFRQTLEAAGAHEVRVEIERAETQRRRETGISAEMNPIEALRTWLETKPEIHPLADALIVEAIRIEEALREGGAG